MIDSEVQTEDSLGTTPSLIPRYESLQVIIILIRLHSKPPQNQKATLQEKLLFDLAAIQEIEQEEIEWKDRGQKLENWANDLQKKFQVTL